MRNLIMNSGFAILFCWGPSWRVFRTNLLPRRELRVTMSSSVSP